MSPLWKFAWVVTPRTPHLISQILRIGPSAKLVSGEASPVAQLVKVIRLDRFACCGLELYDRMAVAEENAGYGDRSAPVRDRSAKFSITALVMHPPIHRRILRPLPVTALIQIKIRNFQTVSTVTSCHTRLLCRASIRKGRRPTTSSPPPGSVRGSLPSRGSRRSILPTVSAQCDVRPYAGGRPLRCEQYRHPRR